MCVLAFAVQTPATNGGEAARRVSIETRALDDSVTVGQRLHITYAAKYPDTLTLLPPEEFDTGNCRLISVNWRDRSKSGYTTKQAEMVVLPMTLDNAHVPPAKFLFLSPAGDTLVAFSDEVNVPVRQLTGADSQPKPLKPQWQAPRSYLRLLLVGGAVLLAAAAVWFWLRRRRKTPVIEAPTPRLPADYVALKALAEIEGMNLPEGGKFKSYYTLVIDVVRHYIEQRFDVQTMDRTTDEILYDLSRRNLDVAGLEPLLHEADLVKFAKYKPDVGTANGAMRTSRDLVVQTTPRPVAAVGGE